MSKIRIGAPIYCQDGQEAGDVDRVVIDPKSGRLTHVVARARHALLHDVVVPVEAVREYRDDGVFLDLSVLDFEGMPEYYEENFVSPAAGEMPLGPYSHSEVLLPVAHVNHPVPEVKAMPLGKEVECHEGLCGIVDELLLDPVTNQVLSFRLKRIGPLARDVVVPVEWVLDARGERVHLDCNVRQLDEELPRSHPDERAVSS